MCGDSRAATSPTRPDDYAAPTPLSPGYCALSMLFSDWDRTGRRDLRVSNDRHYNVDGEEQLWRMTPGDSAAPCTRRRRLAKLRHLGHGHRQPGPDRRRQAGGVPHQPGRQQAADPRRRRHGRRRTRTSRSSRGVTATQPFAGGQSLPSTAWHPAFEDVNNDGLVDLFVAKGNVEAQEGYATKDPSQPAARQRARDVHGRGEARRAARTSTAAAVRPSWTSTRTACSTSSSSSVTRTRRLWRNVGTGTGRQARAHGRLGGARAGAGRSRNRDAIGAWIEVRIGGAVMEPRGDRRRRPCGRPAGPTQLRAG